MNAVQAFDPGRRLFVELVDVGLLAEYVLFVGVRLRLANAVRVMRLVVEDEDVLLSADGPPQHSSDHRGVALDVFLRFDEDALEISAGIELLVEDVEKARRALPRELVQRQVPFAARGGRLRADVDELADSPSNAGLHHFRAHAAGLHRLRLEDVPVRDEHAPALQVRHQVRRNDVARAVQTRVSPLWIKFSEAAADRHVWAGDKDDVRVIRVGVSMDLVENAPRGEHRHDGRLAAAGGHLARVACERFDAFRAALVARLVGRNVDSLEKVTPRFYQKDDGFSHLELREEQPFLAAVPPPVFQQLQRRPGDARPSLDPPLPDAVANEVHESKLDALSDGRAFRACILPRRPVEVVRRPPARVPPRLGSFLDQPMLRRLVEGGTNDRLRDFEFGHVQTSSG